MTSVFVVFPFCFFCLIAQLWYEPDRFFPFVDISSTNSKDVLKYCEGWISVNYLIWYVDFLQRGQVNVYDKVRHAVIILWRGFKYECLEKRVRTMVCSRKEEKYKSVSRMLRGQHANSGFLIINQLATMRLQKGCILRYVTKKAWSYGVLS